MVSKGMMAVHSSCPRISGVRKKVGALMLGFLPRVTLKHFSKVDRLV